MNKRSETIEYRVGKGSLYCRYSPYQASYSITINATNIKDLKQSALELCKVIEAIESSPILDSWNIR